MEVIKIGYIDSNNERIDINQFSDYYDIVLVDGGIDIVEWIIDGIYQ